MKQNNMFNRLKQGLKSKPILILSAIIVALIIINLLQAKFSKRQYAKLQVKEGELLQCQSTNDQNQTKTNELEDELDRCVGIRRDVENRAKIAEIEINNFKELNKSKLNETIKNLQQLPPTECDDIVINSDAVLMWRQATDNQN